MFLASVFPISERSAVNLNGKVNTANITIFADETAYIHDMAAVSASQALNAKRNELANTLFNLTSTSTQNNEKEKSVTSASSESGYEYDIYKCFDNLKFV